MLTCDGIEKCSGGILTSGQGTGLAEAMLPKRMAARTAGNVILNCILAKEGFWSGVGGRRVGRRCDLRLQVGRRASSEVNVGRWVGGSMAWGRKGYYKPSGKVAHAPWEKRDSWLQIGQTTEGNGGPQADIHAVIAR